MVGIVLILILEGEVFLSLTMVFSLFGGLGLFIYGMKLMGEGLQKSAGSKLKRLLGLLTTNRVAGLLVGTGVTAIIQSSSATTVMVVGFVNAGLMSLKQSIGVIMGANIGTTVTAQLIAFKLSHYSLHAIAIGAALYLFSKKDRTKQIGQVILGFGILFLGLTIMKDTMRPLRDSQLFVEAMKKFGKSPILGVLLGAVMTVMVQSSSASIGILMSLMAVGVLDYQAAVPILLGDNIGTTVTALLSSVGANRNAKRAATAHMVFNIIGTLVFLSILYLIPDFPQLLENILTELSHRFGSELSPTRMLANTHSVFNILNALIWLPFVNVIVTIVNYIVPAKEDENTEHGLTYLDNRMLQTPSVAVEQFKNEVTRMFEICLDMVYEAKVAFLEYDDKLIKEVRKKEEIVNELEEELLVFLTQIPQTTLSEDDIKTIDMYFIIIDAIESIGDDADELIKLLSESMDKESEFSKEAWESITAIFNIALDLLDRTKELIMTEEIDLVDELINGEKEVDKLQFRYRDEHMNRLTEGNCNPDAAIIYLEILESLEHITDQTADIANSFKERR